MAITAEKKALLLGTAQWGWTVSRNEAFDLLDAWIEAGRYGIDVATNYPINKNASDFRAAEHILEDYIRAHGLTNLQITMKIGSLDNMRTPDVNLSPSFMLMMAAEYQRRFGPNLHTVMVHWDNRSDAGSIRDTLGALTAIQSDLGIRPGISGVRYPDIYAEANKEFDLHFDIQFKHNVLHTDFPRYDAFSPKKHRFYAYGINAGGVKLEGPYPVRSTFLARGGDLETAAAKLERIRGLIPAWNGAFVRPPIRTMNHLGLVYAGLQSGCHGVVLGVSSRDQLGETLDFWRNLEIFDYSDVWVALNKIKS